MTDFTFTESEPYEHYNRVDAQMVCAVDVFALTDKGLGNRRPWGDDKEGTVKRVDYAIFDSISVDAFAFAQFVHRCGVNAVLKKRL